MLSTITRLEADRLIEPLEADVAREAEDSGTYRHTIGYELEVLPSAASEIPRLEDMDDTRRSVCLRVAFQATHKYGYVLGSDGLYELASPPSRHPLPLAIATRGIVRLGVLPRQAQGVVTAHVSVGSSKDLGVRQPTTNRLVNILRAVELAGGTTPGRLWAPVKQAQEADESFTSSHSWDQSGNLGIAFDRSTDSWKGQNNRAEFRTLRYQSPEQFERTLETLYFLTRGLLSGSNRPARHIYNRFEQWFSDYQQAYGLPDIGGLEMEHLAIDEFKKIKLMSRYIRPYVEHLADADKSLLHSEVSKTVADLSEEFGMTPSAIAHTQDFKVRSDAPERH